MSELVYRDGERGSDALATGKWASEEELGSLRLNKDDFWLGYAPTESHFPVGYNDDRHICTVAGSRSGKGTTSIINNLCLWPGSVVVVDPKGENATVTARRRGKGSEYCHGLGQAVHILDPFNTVENAEEYRSRFNPLDAIDPNDEEAIDEAGRIADAIVVQEKSSSSDPFWEESARALIRGLILHVLTDPHYDERRNLITVRRLISQGDWESVKILEEAGEDEIPSAYELLFEGLRRNDHFDGVIAGVGNSFGSMATNSAKTFESVIQVANRNTEFMDSPGMKRCLEGSDFELASLKTDPGGMSLYLSLPQRYMNTHFRWLRMMIALTVTEMEKVRQQPVSGHRVLMVLDEFAGLKRMEVIENAAAQIAGYGVKLWFVVQSLGQLKETYKDNWQTFLANCGLQLFAQVDDEFTRKYVSEALGETELKRRTESFSHSTGTSSGTTMSTGTMFAGGGKNAGMNFLAAMIPSSTSGTSVNTSQSWSEAIHKTHLLSPSEVGRAFARVGERSHRAYPGIQLALVPGKHPALVHKANYFEDHQFIGLFDPHPDHPKPLKLEEQRALPDPKIEDNAKRRANLAKAQNIIDDQKRKYTTKRMTHIVALGFAFGFGVLMLGSAITGDDPYAKQAWAPIILIGFLAAVVFGGLRAFKVSNTFFEALHEIAFQQISAGSTESQVAQNLPAPGFWFTSPQVPETIQSVDYVPSRSQSDGDIVKSHLKTGNLMLAIKEYRVRTGCDLAQARKEIKEIYGHDV